MSIRRDQPQPAEQKSELVFGPDTHRARLHNPAQPSVGGRGVESAPAPQCTTRSCVPQVCV